MNHTLVIAEAGVNHNGDLNLAFRLAESAAEAGADVVKFQTFDAKQLATASASNAGDGGTPVATGTVAMFPTASPVRDGGHVFEVVS